MCNPNLQLLETDGAEDDFKEQNQTLLLLGSPAKWKHCSSVLQLLLYVATRAHGLPALLQLQLQWWVVLDTPARAPSMLPQLMIV